MLITRREWLGWAGAWGAVALTGRQTPKAAGFARATPTAINAERLRLHIEGLSRFGRPPGGTFASGVSRLAYTDADLDARRYVLQLMRDAGLVTRIDPAGNIVGRRAGRANDTLPILFGSHVDSVPEGGNFDGDLGTLAAIEVVQTLAERGVTTGHPLDVVVWANEEGVAYGNGLDGSRAAAGERAAGDSDQVWNGVRKADAIRKIGGDPDRLTEARRPPGSIHAYLELHIEQGGTLDQAGIPIGVVEGIVAIDRYEAVISGVPNHAGTTPMPLRHDALVAASRLVLAVRDVVTSEAGGQVGTVGQLAVTPNAPNVIPGTVRHTIELRDLSEEKISRLAGVVRQRAARDCPRHRHDHHHHAYQSPPGGAGSPGHSACDRVGGRSARPATPPARERRGARCPDDGPDRADGDDLRAERRGHQPFAGRGHHVGRLRPRRGGPAGIGTGD